MFRGRDGDYRDAQLVFSGRDGEYRDVELVVMGRAQTIPEQA